jgi:hypothetical protein
LYGIALAAFTAVMLLVLFPQIAIWFLKLVNRFNHRQDEPPFTRRWVPEPDYDFDVGFLHPSVEHPTRIAAEPPGEVEIRLDLTLVKRTRLD